MAWCRQATSHYLSQCWPRSMSPHGITRPQWVKSYWTAFCSCQLEMQFFLIYLWSLSDLSSKYPDMAGANFSSKKAWLPFNKKCNIILSYLNSDLKSIGEIDPRLESSQEEKHPAQQYWANLLWIICSYIFKYISYKNCVFGFDNLHTWQLHTTSNCSSHATVFLYRPSYMYGTSSSLPEIHFPKSFIKHQNRIEISFKYQFSNPFKGKNGKQNIADCTYTHTWIKQRPKAKPQIYIFIISWH